MVISDLIAFEKLGHTAGEFFHDAVLAGDHGRYIHGSVLDTDAMGLVVILQMVKMLAGIQQGLGRDATNIQAGAARCGFAILAGEIIDTRSLEAKLRRSDSGYIATRATTNYDQVKFVSHHSFLFLFGRDLRTISCKCDSLTPGICQEMVL